MASPLLARRLMPLAIASLVAAAAWLQARGAAFVVGDAMAAKSPAYLLVPGGNTAPASPAPRSPHATSAQSVAERSPLDSTRRRLLPEAEGPSPGEAPAEASLPDDIYQAAACEGLRAAATAAGPDARTSFAIVEGPAGVSMVRQGEPLSVGPSRGVVWLVGHDRVWVWTSEGLCQAGASAPPPPSSASAAPSPSAQPQGSPAQPAVVADLVAKIKRVGPNELEVDRSALERAREGFAELGKTARFLPEMEGGRMAGVKLMGVKPGSLWQALGLESGDRLEKINGFELGSPESMLQAYARLQTADALRLELTRGGKKSQIDLKIR